ncbi:MAG: TIGR02186 family protein [Alphaproteobacteria bacterium]
MAGLVAAGLAGPASPPAGGAEQARLSADLSDYEIQISSSFAGTSLILFGSIDGIEPSPVNRNEWDVVVVVRGPDVPVTVRRKERLAGVWMNRTAVTFANVPSYYFVASSRPLETVTSEWALRRNRVGIANLNLLPASRPPSADLENFRDAVVRTQRQEGLIDEAPYGVTFRSDTLFRTEIDFPAKVPVGQYRVEVHLLKNGLFVDAQSIPLYVNKTGIERRIFELAHETPLLYGILAVLIALGAGYLASLPFRRN